MKNWERIERIAQPPALISATVQEKRRAYMHCSSASLDALNRNSSRKCRIQNGSTNILNITCFSISHICAPLQSLHSSCHSGHRKRHFYSTLFILLSLQHSQSTRNNGVTLFNKNIVFRLVNMTSLWHPSSFTDKRWIAQGRACRELIYTNEEMKKEKNKLHLKNQSINFDFVASIYSHWE